MNFIIRNCCTQATYTHILYRYFCRGLKPCATNHPYTQFQWKLCSLFRWKYIQQNITLVFHKRQMLTMYCIVCKKEDCRQNIFIFISNSILNIMLEVNGLICFHLETIILLLCSFINFKHNGFKRANDMKSIATLNKLCSLVFPEIK